MTVTVNPAAGGGGTGLTGRYFNDPSTGAHFTTLVDDTRSTQQSISIGARATRPIPGVQLDYFSVRWTGQLLAPVKRELHDSATLSDEGVRLWVNGQLVIDNWIGHAATWNTSPAVTLTAGVRYSIKLEYYERTNRALVQLRWTPPGQQLSLIPTPTCSRKGTKRSD